MSTGKPVGILLAAGSSKRFGSNKLLQHVIDDKPMLLVSAEKLAAVLPGSIVVISEALVSHAARLQKLGLRTVVNLEAGQGMAGSIACGIRASAKAGDDASAWLIMLADMPYIKTETIELLAKKLTQGAGNDARIIAPICKQQRGHPVGFGRAYKDELLALSGDIGARNIIANHQQNLELVTVDDAGVLTDVDYADDIIRTS